MRRPIPVASVPPHASLSTLRQAAAACRACDLWRNATQTVFGEGAAHAPVMMVGEQPGDAEDHMGRPFVGAAGRLLDDAIAAAGLERRQIYVTNAVKHFKWEPRGSRRIHKKPNALEILICRPWLEAEILTLKPRVLVCLGATAAQALFGRDFRVTRDRGKLISGALAPFMLATLHPAAILRAPDDATRHAQTRQLAADLGQIPRLLALRRAG